MKYDIFLNDKKLVEGYHVVYRQVHLVKFDTELVEKLVVMLFHKPKKRTVYRPIQKKQKMSVSFAEKVIRAQLQIVDLGFNQFHLFLRLFCVYIIKSGVCCRRFRPDFRRMWHLCVFGTPHKAV